MYLEHVHYLDKIDISSIAKGVKSRLHKNIAFWENIGANEFVVKPIRVGFVIPFENNPLFMFIKHNKSALIYSDFVDEVTS